MRKLSVLVWLILALAGCRTVPTVPFAEGGEPILRSGSIIFAGVDGNLYATVGPNAVMQVTKRREPSQIVNSAYGWAGTRVVYATQDVIPNRGITGSIYSVVPGANPRRLLRRPGFAPFFLYPTPDNSRVAYLGSEFGRTGLVMGSIGLDGRGDLVHGRGQPIFAAWSPDSSTLLTHVGSPLSPSGSVMQLQSVESMIAGEALEPPLGFATGRFQAPAFSPDGRSFAIALRENGLSTVAITTGSAEETHHVAPLAAVAALAWSPDGRGLAFVDGEHARVGGIIGKLWLADPNDRELILVSERATAFFWSPDSTKIIYFEPHIVANEGRTTLLYRVGVYRTFDGRSEIIATMQPAAAFVGLIIPFFDQYHRAYTIWSPDSRLVVLNATDDRGVPVIHLVDTEKLRTGDRFTAAYRVPVQSAPDAGLIPEDGITSRVVAFGTVPFFSGDEGPFSSPRPDRPEIDS